MHWTQDQLASFLRLRQECFLDPAESNRPRFQEAAMHLQESLFSWYFAAPGGFPGVFKQLQSHIDHVRDLRRQEADSLQERRFLMNVAGQTVPPVESHVPVDQWQDIFGSLGIRYGAGHSFDRFLLALDSLTNPSLRINHRYLGELLPHDNMVSYFSSVVATFLNENAVIGKVSPCVTHMEQALVASLSFLIGWEGRIELRDDSSRLPVNRLPTPHPASTVYDRWRREQPTGTIVSGGTVANISAIRIAASATANYLLGWGEAVQTLGLTAALRIVQAAYPDRYANVTAILPLGSHYSVEKACYMAGLGKGFVRSVPGSSNPWILDGAAVRAELREHVAAKCLPVAIVAIAGKTETGYVDRIQEIVDVLSEKDALLPSWSEVRERQTAVRGAIEAHTKTLSGLPHATQRSSEILDAYKESQDDVFISAVPDRIQHSDVKGGAYNRLFLHVDAAHGGAFLTVPTLRASAFRGIECADTVTLDGHKMFYCYYPCGGLLVRTARWARTLHSGRSSYINEETNHESYGEDSEYLRKAVRGGRPTGKLMHGKLEISEKLVAELEAIRNRNGRPTTALKTELEHQPYLTSLEGSRGAQGIMQLYFNLNTLGFEGYRLLLEWVHILTDRCQEAISLGRTQVRTVTEAPLDDGADGAALLGPSAKHASAFDDLAGGTARIVPVQSGRLLRLSAGSCNQILATYIPLKQAIRIATKAKEYWLRPLDGAAIDGARPGRNNLWRTIHYLWRVNEHLWFQHLYANPAFAYYVGHTIFSPELPGADDGQSVAARVRLSDLLSKWNIWTRGGVSNASTSSGKTSRAPSGFFAALAETLGAEPEEEGAIRFFCHKIVIMHPYSDESVLSDLLHKMVFWGQRSAEAVDRADGLCADWLRARKGEPGAEPPPDVIK